MNAYFRELKKVIFTYCFVLSVSVQLTAQTSSAYTFEFFNASHGLPSSEVLSLAKDNKGFLWIGTSAGLSRYDGYNFQNFLYTKNNELIGYVNVIKPGNNGLLWIGTGTGLFCYSNDEIRKISSTSSSPQGVLNMLIEKNGDAWLSTENGPATVNLNTIDITGKKKINLSDLVIPQWTFKSAQPDNRRTLNIAKAEDGTVFIATALKIFRLSNEKLELLHSIADAHDVVQSLFPITQNKFYFDCAATELNLYENGIIKNLNHEKLYQPGVNKQLKGFWYGATMGLYYFHPESGTASSFISIMDHDVQYPSSMMQDDNFFWLATHDGLVKIKPSLFTLYHIPETVNNNIDYYAMLYSKDGKLLFGSNRGKILQKNDTSFALIQKYLVPTADIRYLYEDKRGWLWAASSYQGLVLLRDGGTEVYTEKEGLHDNSILFLLQTNDKFFAIGDHGISEVIIDAKNNVSFKKFYFESFLSRHAKFFSAITGPDGIVWAGGQEGIVYLKDDSLHLFTLTKNDLPVNFLIKDKKGDVWIATDGNGILHCRFNKNNRPEIIRHFTEKDGLNTLNYTTLLADEENNIWAGSSHGISFIGQNEKFTNKVLNFDQSDGFIQPGYSNIALYSGTDRIIWVTTIFGIASFNPIALFESESSPVVYVTDVKQLKTAGTESNLSDKHSFLYDQNSFSISFTALNYAYQEGIQYYYKMEGLDTNWVNTQNARTVSFASLAPGSYSFHVKAINNKGRWSEKNAVYSFEIRPPYWQTWWFRLIAALAVTGIIFFFIRRRITAIKARAAIKQQMTELEVKALRAQMNPHFIFNAMNSIQQFTLKNDIDNANLYISKFSTLLRKVLHSSQQSFISLEEEIDQLQLYLEIEKQRLGDEFSYSIQTDDEIETDALKIPGMLIQPFVENALKHGLSTKEGKKVLAVQFFCLDDHRLKAVITDNGIGRKKAVELKQQQEKLLPHLSKGISLVEERLHLFSKTPVKNLIQTEDLYDSEGMPAGTRVSLTIPLRTG